MYGFQHKCPDKLEKNGSLQSCSHISQKLWQVTLWGKASCTLFTLQERPPGEGEGPRLSPALLRGGVLAGGSELSGPRQTSSQDQGAGESAGHVFPPTVLQVASP